MSKLWSFSVRSIIICCVAAGLFLAGGLAHASADAIPTPTPKATPTPLFTYWGVLRAYYFGRTNGDTCLSCKLNKGSPDALAFNFGGELHGQINVPHSPWAVAATYFGAYPFGANWPGPLNNTGYNPLVDNTVPGYPINLFGEAYIQYKTPGIYGITGKEVLTVQQSPWSPPSDTRIAPESYQGTLLSGNVTPYLNVGAMYMARFRSRVVSSFDANTLLTSCNTAYNTGKGPVEGYSGTFTVPGDPCNKPEKDQGFLQYNAQLNLNKIGVAAQAYQYQVYDVVSMTYLNAQWNFDKKSPFNPFIAGQFLGDNNLGQALVGTVHSYTAGGEIGATIYHNLLFIAAYNGSPATTYIVPSKECSGTAASPQGAKPGVIFGGVASTANTSLPTGVVTCYGGGIASPYTDSLATDPLYTTSLTQGMADVHKPGTGVKSSLAWQTNDKQLRLYVSYAWYDYSLPGFTIASATSTVAPPGTELGNGDSRSEFDADFWYFFNRVRAGTYKGLSIRQRYGDRSQPFSPYDFKYSRTQLEYDF